MAAADSFLVEAALANLRNDLRECAIDRDALVARLARAEGLLREAISAVNCAAFSPHDRLADRIDAFLREPELPLFDPARLLGVAMPALEGRCSYCGGEPCCYPSEGKPECLRDARLRSERTAPSHE